MADSARDPVTGTMTTGHEWNGIEELDTPIPRVVLFFLAVTTLFAIGYWLLMPAWPLGVTYTKGLLGIDQREVVARQFGHSMPFVLGKASPSRLIDCRNARATALKQASILW